MGVRVGFGNCVPFPHEQGMWVRLVFVDSPDKEGSVVIVQGTVMNFEGESVMLMNDHQVTTIEVLRAGDERCRSENMTVAYTKIESIQIKRENVKRNGVTPNEQQPAGG